VHWLDFALGVTLKVNALILISMPTNQYMA
jgi:hypothetical protein